MENRMFSGFGLAERAPDDDVQLYCTRLWPPISSIIQHHKESTRFAPAFYESGH